MKILSHNEVNKIDTSKVEFEEFIDANYDDIVEAFGEPIEGDLYKTDIQWNLKLVADSGKRSYVATLTNFKTGGYLKGDGLKPHDNPHWSVSSSNTSIDAATQIEQYIKRKVKK